MTNTKQEIQDQQYFKLIEGDFTHQEAKNMLYDLINSKIKFHNKDAFSKKIKTNRDISHSQKRIDELTATYKKMMQFIHYANRQKMKLSINAIIEINLLNK
jgi:hypothetical protein